MRVVLLTGALGAAAVCACPSAVLAQDGISAAGDIAINPSLSRAGAAGVRSEPGLSPQRLTAGPFGIDASLVVVGGYDSNVLRGSTEQDDAFVAVIPRAEASLNTGRFSLRASGIASLRRFADVTTENAEEFQLGTGFGMAVSEGVSINANGSFGHLVQERSSVGSIAGAVEPVSYDQLTGSLGARIAVGDFSIAPSVRYSQLDFSPVEVTSGADADLGFRNSRSYGGNLRLGYQISDFLEVFVNGALDEDESTAPAAGLARDSSEKIVLAGISGEITPLLSGDIAVGYRERDYDNVRYNDTDGLTFRTSLQWFPTELISFRLGAQQSVRNSGELLSAGVVTSSAALDVYYDPTRRLRIAGTIGYSQSDFKDVGSTARRPSLRMQAQYRFGPHLALGSYVSISRQEVDGVQIVESNTSFNMGLGIVLTP